MNCNTAHNIVAHILAIAEMAHTGMAAAELAPISAMIRQMQHGTPDAFVRTISAAAGELAAATRDEEVRRHAWGILEEIHGGACFPMATPGTAARRNRT